jgi:hypothetical protein
MKPLAQQFAGDFKTEDHEPRAAAAMRRWPHSISRHVGRDVDGGHRRYTGGAIVKRASRLTTPQRNDWLQQWPVLQPVCNAAAALTPSHLSPGGM